MPHLIVLLGLFVFSDAYVNIALHKPAHQLHQYNPGVDTFDASNAVDGLISDLRAWGGQCVVSADYYEVAIWWVNLTRIHSIHHITIYYRTDNLTWNIYNGLTIGSWDFPFTCPIQLIDYREHCVLRTINLIEAPFQPYLIPPAMYMDSLSFITMKDCLE